MPQLCMVIFNFQKTRNCSNCNFFLGGKYVAKDTNPPKKRRKLHNPDSVTVCQFSGNTLFSVKVTTRDDRTFCLVSEQSRLCYLKACKNFRSMTVASGQMQLDKFSCPHLEKLRSTVAPLEKYDLTPTVLPSLVCRHICPMKSLVMFLVVILMFVDVEKGILVMFVISENFIVMPWGFKCTKLLQVAFLLMPLALDSLSALVPLIPFMTWQFLVSQR